MHSSQDFCRSGVLAYKPTKQTNQRCIKATRAQPDPYVVLVFFVLFFINPLLYSLHVQLSVHIVE